MSIIFAALPIPPISEFGEPSYSSAEQALEAIDMKVRLQGFAVSKRSSKPTQVLLECAQIRAYKAVKPPTVNLLPNQPNTHTVPPFAYVPISISGAIMGFSPVELV
jgi:hypothetical protein